MCLHSSMNETRRGQNARTTHSDANQVLRQWEFDIDATTNDTCWLKLEELSLLLLRVGRLRSIRRWYCSAALRTNCILENRCSTSIQFSSNSTESHFRPLNSTYLTITEIIAFAFTIDKPIGKLGFQNLLEKVGDFFFVSVTGYYGKQLRKWTR